MFQCIYLHSVAGSAAGSVVHGATFLWLVLPDGFYAAAFLFPVQRQHILAVQGEQEREREREKNLVLNLSMKQNRDKRTLCIPSGSASL